MIEITDYQQIPENYSGLVVWMVGKHPDYIQREGKADPHYKILNVYVNGKYSSSRLNFWRQNGKAGWQRDHIQFTHKKADQMFPEEVKMIMAYLLGAK